MDKICRLLIDYENTYPDMYFDSIIGLQMFCNKYKEYSIVHNSPYYFKNVKTNEHKINYINCPTVFAVFLLITPNEIKHLRLRFNTKDRLKLLSKVYYI